MLAWKEVGEGPSLPWTPTVCQALVLRSVPLISWVFISITIIVPTEPTIHPLHTANEVGTQGPLVSPNVTTLTL